jgi:hypothetical protein
MDSNHSPNYLSLESSLERPLMSIDDYAAEALLAKSVIERTGKTEG